MLDVSEREIIIDEELTIEGPGAEKLTISGANEEGEFNGTRIFRIDYEMETEVGLTRISGVTLANGFANYFDDFNPLIGNLPGDQAGRGGAILTRQSIELRGVDLRDNSADVDGGALSTPQSDSSNSFNIEQCIFENNQAGVYIGGNGGAIFFYGGVADELSSVRIVDTLIANNQAAGTGGGAYLGRDEFTQLEIDRTEIVNNTASSAGGIFVTLSEHFFEESHTISRSTISGNMATAFGGFDINQIAGGGKLIISDTTISNNDVISTDGGGRLYLRGDGVEFVNSTISNNTTTQEFDTYVAGGLRIITDFDVAGSEVLIAHTTITKNTGYYGAGLYLEEQGDFTGNIVLDHTVVSDNTAAGGTNVNIFGTVNTTASTYNLVGTSGTGGLTGGTNQISNAPMLSALADNGGFLLPSGARIQTHVPLSGSPLINAGALSGDFPEFDQRGTPFDRVYDDRIDIGAVEAQPGEMPELLGDYNLNGIVDAADYTVWRDTLGAMVSPPFAGADGDGSSTIEQPDYDVWTANFGDTLGTAAGSMAAGAFNASEDKYPLPFGTGRISTRPYSFSGTLVDSQQPTSPLRRELLDLALLDFVSDLDRDTKVYARPVTDDLKSKVDSQDAADAVFDDLSSLQLSAF